MNLKFGTEAAVPFLGIHKWDFRCSAAGVFHGPYYVNERDHKIIYAFRAEIMDGYTWNIYFDSTKIFAMFS
jgi:hypothetical protein